VVVDHEPDLVMTLLMLLREQGYNAEGEHGLNKSRAESRKPSRRSRTAANE